MHLEVDDSGVRRSHSEDPEVFPLTDEAEVKVPNRRRPSRRLVLVPAGSLEGGNDDHDVRVSPVCSHGHEILDRVALVAQVPSVPSARKRLRIMSGPSQVTTVVDSVGANRSSEVVDMAADSSEYWWEDDYGQIHTITQGEGRRTSQLLAAVCPTLCCRTLRPRT